MTEFLNASFVIQLHVIAALIAFVVGPIALVRRRRDMIHKVVGYMFVVGMVGTALSSFFIHTIRIIGPFSPIHILSVVSLCSLFVAIRAIKLKQITAHNRIMWRLYSQAMGIAGMFTFLPGRLMNDMVPYLSPWSVFVLACVIFGALLFGISRAMGPVLKTAQSG